jgi:hypothetical protein
MKIGNKCRNFSCFFMEAVEGTAGIPSRDLRARVYRLNADIFVNFCIQVWIHFGVDVKDSTGSAMEWRGIDLVLLYNRLILMKKKMTDRHSHSGVMAAYLHIIPPLAVEPLDRLN